MARAHFDITGDNSNIVSVINDTEKKMEDLSKVMSDLGKSFDISTPEKQIKALQTAIKGNERVIKDYERQLKELEKAQRAAALAGNTSQASKLGLDMQVAATRMQQTVSETNSLKSALNELNSSAEKTDGIMVKLMGGTENFNKILAGLPPGLRMVITEVNGLRNTFNALLATPIAPFLAALALAYASLHSWLTKSADGQRTFSYLTGYASGMVSELRDRLIELGREMYDTFDKSIPLIKRVGEIIAGIGKMVVGTFKYTNGAISTILGNITKLRKLKRDDFSKAIEGVDEMFEGVDLISGKSNSTFGKRAKEMGELNQKERDLAIRREKWAIEEAKLDEKIADARVRMMASTEAGRASAAKELKALNDRKYDQQIQFAKEELEIIRAKNKLRENSQEDLNREYQLEAKIHQLQAQKISGSGRAERIMSSVGRQEQRQEEQLQNELNQILQSNLEKRISIMDEGGKKELAQINANYDKQMEAVRKQKEKWMRMSKEMGRGGTLTPEQQSALAAAETLASVQREKQTKDLADKTRKEYIQKYGDYNEKLLAITEDYNRKKAAANQNDIYELKLLEREYEKQLTALRKEYSATYALIFTDAKNLTKSQLDLAIELTSKELRNAIPATQEYLVLLNKLQKFRAQKIDAEGWGFNGIINALKGYEKEQGQLESAIELGSQDLVEYHAQQMAAYTAEYERSWQEVSQGFSKLGNAMEKFRDGFGGFGDTIADIGGLFSGIAEQCNDMKVAFSKTATEGEKLSAGLSAVFSIISMIGTSISNNRKAQEEWNRTIEQGAHKLAMLELEKLDYKQDNIFGVENPYKKAIDGAVQYGKAIEDLQGNINKLAEGQIQADTKKAIDWKNVGTGAGSGAAAGAVLGSIIPGVGNVIGAAIGAGVGAIIGAFSTKTVPVFESLAKKYGTLVMEDYSLNPELLADYDKLDEATKQIVDNWEEIRAKAEEAEQQMRENFSDLAGDIGTQLSDALVNAFRNGDLYSAIDDFHSTMTKTIEDILSQLVFSATFGEMFKKLESDMMASFGIGGDQDITDDLIEFEKKYPELLKSYEEAMTSVQDSMRKMGYDVFGSDYTESGGTKGSFAGMSQAMGASLEGRFTAVQIAAETIAERMITNMAIMTAMSNYMAGSNTTLSEIRDAHIREVGYLEDIARQTRPLSTLVSVGDKLDIIASKL